MVALNVDRPAGPRQPSPPVRPFLLLALVAVACATPSSTEPRSWSGAASSRAPTSAEQEAACKERLSSFELSSRHYVQGVGLEPVAASCSCTVSSDSAGRSSSVGLCYVKSSGPEYKCAEDPRFDVGGKPAPDAPRGKQERFATWFDVSCLPL